MHERLVGSRSHMDRMRRALFVCGVAALSTLGWDAPRASAQDAGRAFNPALRPEYREPVTLATTNGVLEVRLTARQGRATLDTVATPVQNFLLFDYELIRGTASDGRMSGGNLYPAPTLQVFPGETLIVHLENGLSDLTIRDFYNPQYTAQGPDRADLPCADDLFAGQPPHPRRARQPEGQFRQRHAAHPAGHVEHLYLRHPDEHAAGRVLVPQPSARPDRRAGLYRPRRPALHRTHRRQPADRHARSVSRSATCCCSTTSSSIAPAASRSSTTRTGPQFVSTIVPPQGDELANGTYRPLLAPVNFDAVEAGEQYFTVWYAGPLSIHNERGLLQFIPSNLQRFTAHGGQAEQDVPANPSLPDYKRDVQFTVNGQFQPVIKSKAGPDRDLGARERERHRLHERPAHRDGDRTASADRHRRPGRQSLSRRPLSAHRQRHAAAHSAGQPLRDRGDHAGRRASWCSRCRRAAAAPRRSTRRACSTPTTAPTTRRPCWARSASCPSADQLRRRLLRLPDPGAGARRALAGARASTTAFVEGQPLGAYTSFVDLSGVTPDVKREILISGRLPQQPREQGRSQGLRLRVRRRRLSQRAADPAAARLGRGVAVRQPQQRRASRSTSTSTTSR